MCGEKGGIIMTWFNDTGSPPHVRGKATCKGYSSFYIGITPACAGKSQPNHDTEEKSGDHPRMCGEKRIKHCLDLFC